MADPAPVRSPAEPAPASSLPEPAPGFPSLVAIHLRLLVREARAGSVILALLCLLLPLAALVAGGDPVTVESDGPGIFVVPGRILVLVAVMMGLTFFMAYLWPEAVWRNLGLGQRMVLDALPVTRRRQRMARVVAGAARPLALLACLVVTVAILEARGWPPPDMDFSQAAPGLRGVGILVTLAGVLTAYSLSSILALRFGKAFVGLLVLFGSLYLVPVLLIVLGFEDQVVTLARWATQSPFSPLPTLTMWYQGTGADLLPAMGWLLVFGGLAAWVAGRHDQG
jgi:hypothetical protein